MRQQARVCLAYLEVLVKCDAFHSWFDIVNPQYVGTFLQGKHVQCGGAIERSSGVGIERFVDHRFATYPHQDSSVQNLEAMQFAHQCKILLDCFGKSKPRIYKYIHDSARSSLVAAL